MSRFNLVAFLLFFVGVTSGINAFEVSDSFFQEKIVVDIANGSDIKSLYQRVVDNDNLDRLGNDSIQKLHHLGVYQEDLYTAEQSEVLNDQIDMRRLRDIVDMPLVSLYKNYVGRLMQGLRYTWRHRDLAFGEEARLRGVEVETDFLSAWSAAAQRVMNP